MSQRTKANGEGTIYKTGQTWRGQIFIDGKRHSFSGKTKKEVSDKIAAAQTDSARGHFIKKNDVIVKDWCNKCLKHDFDTGKFREQTYIRVQALFDNHLYPPLGEYKLQDLSKAMLEKSYAEIFQKKTGKDYKETTYSHSTVNQLASFFKKYLQLAVDDGLINKNPHVGVELHKLREAKKVFAYNLEDHKKIVEYTRNNGRLYWIFYFLISTGVRFGEAVALTWDDVDMNNKTIKIDKISVEIHGSPVIQERTKTAAGKRTIKISDNVLKFLKEVKASQEPENNYRNLVLCNRNYGIITSANCRRLFQRLCVIIDVEYQGLHALRHTWATRALEKGIAVKTVSQMLGHKNVITTMNIYQDALPHLQEEAAELLNDLF